MCIQNSKTMNADAGFNTYTPETTLGDGELRKLEGLSLFARSQESLRAREQESKGRERE